MHVYTYTRIHVYMHTRTHVCTQVLMLGWRPPAEKGMMSSTHWEVQVVVELMISRCPDSSDGRALDM